VFQYNRNTRPVLWGKLLGDSRATGYLLQNPDAEQAQHPPVDTQETYYYRVDSEESSGTSDRVKSTVNKFTTPGPGERIMADS
jgi:hypothetical protein